MIARQEIGDVHSTATFVDDRLFSRVDLVPPFPSEGKLCV
jgi:hypothetical protein